MCFFCCCNIHYLSLSLIKNIGVCWCEFSYKIELWIVSTNEQENVFHFYWYHRFGKWKIMLFGYIHKKSLHAYLFCVSDPNYITVNQVRCDSINFSFSYCYCERRQLHIRWSMIWSNHFFFVMLKWISKPVRTCRTLMTSYFIWCRIPFSFMIFHNASTTTLFYTSLHLKSTWNLMMSICLRY